MKTSVEKILVHEAENTLEEMGDDKENGSNVENDKDKEQKMSEKEVSPCDATVGVADDCHNFLKFLQVVVLKALQCWRHRSCCKRTHVQQDDLDIGRGKI